MSEDVKVTFLNDERRSELLITIPREESNEVCGGSDGESNEVSDLDTQRGRSVTDLDTKAGDLDTLIPPTPR